MVSDITKGAGRGSRVNRNFLDCRVLWYFKVRGRGQGLGFAFWPKYTVLNAPFPRTVSIWYSLTFTSTDCFIVCVAFWDLEEWEVKFKN